MKEISGVKDEIIKVWGQARNDCLFKQTSNE